MRFLQVPRTKDAALLALVSLPLLIIGCTKKARLYNLTTGEVVPAQFSYNGTGKGTLTAVTSSGEKFKGEYVTLAGGQVSWGIIYASVYGPKGSASGSSSNFASSTEAKQRGSAIATGDKGTIIQCEYITSAWNGGGSGACKDNHDVLYKLMF
ncbi:MAG: hypothetical protein WCD49_07205 [Candidatus Acidiferrales bacterium]